jgi:hypothetical protein
MKKEKKEKLVTEAAEMKSQLVLRALESYMHWFACAATD